MADRIRKRLTGAAGKEEGFTLIELLVVIVILGILMAIAVPAYMGFKDRANKAAAQANLRAALSSVEAYYQDSKTYAGMTVALLQSNYDKGIDSNITVPTATASTFCITVAKGGQTWSLDHNHQMHNSANCT